MSRSPRPTLVLTILLMSVLAFAQNQNSIPTRHNEMTVAQLQALMASGQLTSGGLTQEYLTPILPLGENGPGVTAVLQLNPDALAIAPTPVPPRHPDTSRAPCHLSPTHSKS